MTETEFGKLVYRLMADGTQAINEMQRVEKATKEHADATEASLRRAEQVWNQTRTPAERFKTQVEELRDLATQGAIDWETYSRALDQAQGSYDKATGAVKVAEAGTEEYSQALEDLVDPLVRIQEKQDEIAAQRMWEQTRTDSERQAKQMNEIDRLFDLGLIDVDTYGRAHEKMGERANAAARSTMGGMHGVRRAVHMVGFAMGANDIARPLMMGYFASHMFRGGLESLTGPIVGVASSMTTGVGVGIGVLLTLFGRMQEESTKTWREIGSSVADFTTQVWSAKTSANQALAQVETKQLKKGFEEAFKGNVAGGLFYRLEHFKAFLTTGGEVGFMKALKQDLDDAIAKSETARDRLSKVQRDPDLAKKGRRLAEGETLADLAKEREELEKDVWLQKQDAEGSKAMAAAHALMASGLYSEQAALDAVSYARSREIALVKEKQALHFQQSKVEPLAFEAKTAGLGGYEKKLAEMARDYAQELRSKGVPEQEAWTEAIRATSAAAATLKMNMEATAMGGITNEIVKMNAETAKLGRGKVESKFVDMAIKLAEAMPRAKDGALDMAAAFAKLGRIGAMDALSRAMKPELMQPIRDKIRDTSDEIDRNVVRINYGKEAADAYGMAQKYAFDMGYTGAEGMKRALQELGPEMKQMQFNSEVLAAQKLWEETRTPLEKYSTKMEELNRLYADGAMGAVGSAEAQDLYARSVMKANKELEGQKVQLGQLAAAGSAESLSRIQDYLERQRAPLPGELSKGGAFGGGAAGKVQQSGRGSAASSEVVRKQAQSVTDILLLLKSRFTAPPTGNDSGTVNFSDAEIAY